MINIKLPLLKAESAALCFSTSVLLCANLRLNRDQSIMCSADGENCFASQNKNREDSAVNLNNGSNIDPANCFRFLRE